MKKKISYTNNIDNVTLYGDIEYDDKSSKGLVLIMHGMAEHRERYAYFVKCLVDNGYAVLNADERGHGESAIVKGYFADEDGWNRNVDDLYQLYQVAKQDIDLPLIVFGHSMGTLVARSFLKKYEKDIAKVCMTGMASYNNAAPLALMLCKQIRGMYGKEHRSELMNDMSFGSYNKQILNPRTSFDWLSANEKNVDDYIADPDCGYIFTIQGYIDMLHGMIDAYGTKDFKASKTTLPIKFFSGSDDPCMSGEEGKQYAIKILNEMGYTNVDFEIFNGLRHEILNETSRDEVIANIISFLDKD